MGAFSAFLDVAYGLAGPVAGLVAGQFGYAAVYLLGSVCAFVGAALDVDASNFNPFRSTRRRRDPAA
jgi:fucose permease